MKVFKEKTIFTEEQKVSVFYEVNDIVLNIKEEGYPDTRLYLNKYQSLELANILTQYSEELKDK